MNIHDFKVGDAVLCVDYTRRNNPKLISTTVGSVGRKYIRCNKCGSHKFRESHGIDSEHCLSSIDNTMYLFKNQDAYADYVEHMELRRWVSRLVIQPLSLEQLRKIKMIVEESGDEK